MSSIDLRKSPRSWPEDYGHDNGNYLCNCQTCGEQFIGYKRRVTCRLCSVCSDATPSPEVPSETKDEFTPIQKGMIGLMAMQNPEKIVKMMEDLTAALTRIAELEAENTRLRNPPSA